MGEGTESFGDRGSEYECSGVFAKVVGPHSARRFKFSATGDNAASLASLHMWVSSAPPDSTVLLAIVGIPPAILEVVLATLAPLGVPQVVPPAHSCHALAAVGQHSAGSDAQWHAVHASHDVAYATMPVLNA